MPANMLLCKVSMILVVVGVIGASPLLQEKEEEIKKSADLQWREAWTKLATLEQKYKLEEKSGCQCIKDNCGCCVDLDIPKLHLDTNACVNVSYLPDQYGISLTFSIGKKVYINETISAKNPPPICVGIPEFEKQGSICIDFYDLDYSASTFSGCIKLEARLFHLKVQDVELGCFKFPLATSRPMVLLQKAKRIEMLDVNKKLGNF